MLTVCSINQCTGCNLCASVCPKKCININYSVKNINAIIDTSKCIHCGLCHKICHIENNIDPIEPLFLAQGWAIDDKIRGRGASGGIASAIETNFILNGGIVCSCLFENGDFIYKTTDSIDSLKQFSGSKYVKSNMSLVYDEIKNLLKLGKKVLFVGLPCHSAALKSIIPDGYAKELYTVDLVCHGTPSKRILELFLKQYNLKLDEISEIRFRNKDSFLLCEGEECLDMLGIMDSYSISFMGALTYTDCCYHCKYAKLNRVSDLTLGDSWGSELSDIEKKAGLSLVLCQTNKGKKLLDNANLKLFSVDVEKAISNNAQLQHPSIEPKFRSKFLNNIQYGMNFNKAVFLTMPKQVIKQKLKGYLIKIGIKKPYKIGYGIIIKKRN